MSISIDPQALGWRDDGSESGILRVRPLGIGVVRYPILPAPITFAETANGGSYGPQSGLFAGNPDGSHRLMRMNTTTTLGSFARMWFPFRGRFFGIAWQRSATTTAIDFAVVVDGEAVTVPVQNDYLLNEGITGTQLVDVTASVITHRNLDPDVQHYAAIVLSGNTTAAQQLDLYGFLLDQQEGYQPAPRASTRVNNGTLSTTDAAISLVGGVSERLAIALDRIEFTNTDASTRIVKIKTATSGAEIARITLAAGASDYWPKAGTMPTAINGEAFSADAAGVVNYTVYGAR